MRVYTGEAMNFPKGSAMNIRAAKESDIDAISIAETTAGTTVTKLVCATCVTVSRAT